MDPSAMDAQAALTQAALDWVGHVPDAPAASADLDEAASDAGLKSGCRRPGEAELQTVVAKAAGERLSIPELADDESPLPRGWVLAERGADTCATVRDHLLEAVANLEHGLPAEVAALPAVREQVRRLTELAMPRQGFEPLRVGITGEIFGHNSIFMPRPRVEDLADEQQYVSSSMVAGVAGLLK